MSFVYWLHLPEHVDISKDGYIGVTSKTPEIRFKEHVATSKWSNYILAKAIRKYGDRIIVTTLIEGDTDYCYFIENKLRKQDRQGWNTVKGGGNPPLFNKPHTEEAKKKISEASKLSANSPNNLAFRASQRGVKRSESSRQKMKEKAKGRLSWETSRANRELWKNAGNIFEVYSENNFPGYKALEKLLGLPKNCLAAMHSKFKKQNWNPFSDPRWTDWLLSIK